MAIPAKLFPLVALLLLAAPAVLSQNPGPPPPRPSQVIIDAVVAGKDGPVKDLTQKDFKLSIDGKDQALEGVTLQSAVTWPQRPNKRYIVLVFDTATITSAGQAALKQHVAQFIDAAARPDRYIAVAGVDLFLSSPIQPFTTDAALLKKSLDAAMEGSKGTSTTGMALADQTRYITGTLARAAKDLGAVRGRKELFFFTREHPFQSVNAADIGSAVAEFNKANVALNVVADDFAGASLLASPTGGTAIRMALATPEALGMIADEQDANYLLSFTPSIGLQSGCHRVQVKVATAGLDARSAQGVLRRCYARSAGQNISRQGSRGSRQGFRSRRHECLHESPVFLYLCQPRAGECGG